MERFPVQILVCMAVVAMSAILGYVARLQRRKARFVQLCRLISGGVLLGFIIGACADIYSGDFTAWTFRHGVVPVRIQEYFVTHRLEIDAACAYAPTLGMIVGFGVAFLVVHLRREKS